MNKYPYLSRITSPSALKALSQKEIPALCEEIRRFLIEKVTKNGGHLASNLGVVELTLAMHRVFDSPHDRFIFDVGHQCYVHKIITGRTARFDTLRQPGGLCGFPTPAESEHDAFGAGHSSTSISAALGFSEADALHGSDAYTVAVVGDGAMTGGMIHEALNNCKESLRTIIILNDNEMSISRNTGLFARYLSRIRTTRPYRVTKKRTKKFLHHIPLLGKPTYRLISGVLRWIKRHLYSYNYFEELGILYLGPVDGHNEAALERALQEAKRREGTVLVHVLTKKGKGMAEAEQDPTAFHGVSAKRNSDELAAPGQSCAKSSFHEEAAKHLCTLAEKDKDVCVVTAAMGVGTSMDDFALRYPERFFDVGIAEEHALTFSAGLAANGMKPYFAVYSTFLQRAYDNLLHDVALQGLPVRILVDRAGFSAGDGATHHGVFDVAFASQIPGVTVWAPATFGTLRAMLQDSLSAEGPLLIRYPNADESSFVCDTFYPDGDYENYGLRTYKTEDADAVIVTYGKLICEAMAAAELLEKEGIRTGVVLLECLSPYSSCAERLLAVLPKHASVVFAEEGAAGGAGMFLHRALEKADAGFDPAHAYFALAADNCFSSPKDGKVLSHFGIDRAAMVDTVRRLRDARAKNEKGY